MKPELTIVGKLFNDTALLVCGKASTVYTYYFHDNLYMY